MAVDDVFKLAVTSVYQGQQYMNISAYRAVNETPTTLAMATTLANDFREIARPLQNSNLVYRSWKLYQVYGTGVVYLPADCKREGGLLFEAQYTGTNTGGQTAVQALPPQCALVVTLQTGQIGRRKRGRLYHPGWSEPDQDAGVFTTSVQTALTTSWATFNAKYLYPAAVSNFQIGVFSERTATGCIPNPNGDGHINIEPGRPNEAFTLISNVRVNPTVFTQRRRVVGVGR